jgi:hypothetical protein
VNGQEKLVRCRALQSHLRLKARDVSNHLGMHAYQLLFFLFPAFPAACFSCRLPPDLCPYNHFVGI